MYNFILVIIFLLLSTTSYSEPEAFKVVYNNATAPFSWEENGQMKGIFVDVIEEVISNRLKIPIIHSGLPWPNAQVMIKRNRVDALITVPTQERLSFMTISKIPIAHETISMMTRIDHPELDALNKIQHIKELKPYRIGTNLGNGWVRENLNGFKLKEYRTVEQLLKMVVSGRIDVIVHSKTELLYHSKKFNISNQLLLIPTHLNILTLYLCIRNNSNFAFLVKQFDKELEKLIRSGDLQKITDRYK